MRYLEDELEELEIDEVPFTSLDDLTEEDWDKYLEKFFADALPGEEPLPEELIPEDIDFDVENPPELDELEHPWDKE